MRKDRIYAKRKWNQHGAIEGLPLQLIIMVVIAGVAIVVIMAWLQPWKNKVDLQSVSASPSTINKGVSTQVTITAFDTKNNKLAGVTVVLTGCSISTSGTVSGTTDSTGTVKFTIIPTLPSGTPTGQIDVTATYTGTMTITKTNTITVV